MITFREAKIFLIGNITAFIISLSVILSGRSEQEIISGVIGDAVLGTVFILILSMMITMIASNLNKIYKKKESPKQ